MLSENELALYILPKYKHTQPVKEILLFGENFLDKLINNSDSMAIFFLLKVTYFRFSMVTESKDLTPLMHCLLRVVLI